jgi:LuxR family maltose regulon positive regulatory protein
MSESGTGKRDGRSRHAGRPAFDLVASKLQRPLIPPGSVRRSSLLERLARDAAVDRRVISVVAPAGYGKTTLLSQWAESNGQAFAWVSADERDNDPKVLLTYVAAALDAVEPIAERVFDALASPGSSVPGSVVPRLGSAFSAMTSPVVLVLDDAHILHNSECRAALSVLADHVPSGSRLAVVGRAGPPLPVARLRAEGRISEIGAKDLALTREEASSLLRNADITLSEDNVTRLHLRTEGWPAGLYLAALYLRDGGAIETAVSVGGDNQMSAYMESEFLARVPARQRVFLTRTAALERMSGPLCDEVLGAHGSAATLAELARSNLLLVPLDRRGHWYRYHHLFGDMLLAELRRLEPGMIPVLRRRAAEWCLRNGLPEDALEYFIAVEDVDAAAGLVENLAVPTYRQGRVATVQRWFRWLEDRGEITRHPMVTVLASLLYALTARSANAERWADMTDRWQFGDAAGPDDPLTEAWSALARAILCRHGIKQMLADANEAARTFAAERVVESGASLIQGIARVLSGDLDAGEVSLENAASVAEVTGAPDVAATALCERSLVAMARGQWRRAGVHAGQARAALRRARFEECYAASLVSAVHARVALHGGDIPAARQELVSGQRLRPLLTYALPHVAVQARIELARVHIALADLGGAKTLMREIDELLRRRPDLGTLVDEATALRAQLATERGPVWAGVSALTGAELRLLPQLSTHLSFREIAQDMSLSRHTVKAQAVSIYQKLGVSSRRQAVARAQDVGILDR